MATVFVVQEPVRVDRDTGKSRTVFDISQAAQYGELHMLIPRTPFNLSNEWVVEQLHRNLCNIGPDDSLLLIGEPKLMAMCASVAAHYTGGTLAMLVWVGNPRRYERVVVDLSLASQGINK